jgi:quercetin dioxygenase-like cupin family protein
MSIGINPRLLSVLLAAWLLGCPLLACATAAATVPAETVAQLLTRDVIGAAGKQVLMITVTYVPGGASLPHRHDAQVFVYVLQGQMRMQVRGQAAVTLGPGQTFYEGPQDIHQVSANASQSVPARILVFMVKDKARPASRDVSSEAAP